MKMRMKMRMTMFVVMMLMLVKGECWMNRNGSRRWWFKVEDEVMII